MASALLFRQTCLLAGTAGILATRYVWPGLVAFVVTAALEYSACRAASTATVGRQRFEDDSLPGVAPVQDFRADIPGRAGLLLLCFLIGAGYAFVRAPAPPPCPAWLTAAVQPAVSSQGEELSPAPLRVRARVERSERLPGDLPSGERLRLILRNARPVNNARAVSYAGRIAWTWRLPQTPPRSLPLPGQEVEITLRLSPVRGFANFDQWKLDDYWHDRGVWYRAWSGRNTADLRVFGESSRASALRAELAERFTNALPRRTPANFPSTLSPGAKLLPALIFGDRSHMTEKMRDLFARATLSHSLALSGLHLGYAASLGWLLALGLGRMFPGLWIRITRPRLAVLLALPLAGGYLWLGQAPISLQRAALMLLFGAVLLFVGRPKALLDGLLAAVGLLLLLDPAAFFDLSLQLSALSVAVLALCLPALERLARKLMPKTHLARGGIVLAGTSLCIQVALAPLVVSVFGTIGLCFPLNLIWLPILGAVVMPSAFAGLLFSAIGVASEAVAGTVFPTLPASGALYLAALPCDALMWLLEWMDGAGLLAAPVTMRPHWLSMVGYWLMLFAVWKKDVTGRLLVLCAGIALLIAPWYAARFVEEHGPSVVRLSMLDVGQGQAALVEWQGLRRGGPAPDISSAISPAISPDALSAEAWPPDDALPASGRLLVDGGGFVSGTFDPGKALVAPILSANAPPHIDRAVNSHPDVDHLGGMLYLLENFQVDRYADNGAAASPALTEQEGQRPVQSPARKTRQGAGPRKRAIWKAGDAIALAPGLSLEVLWPPASPEKPTPEKVSPVQSSEKPPHGDAVAQAAAEPAPRLNGNNRSLVLRLLWQGRALAILPGDVDAHVLRRLVEQYGTGGLAADALVLPHHGSAKSLSTPFYQAVVPKVALISCGYGNQWGFPSSGVRRALHDLGIPFYSTARHGQIRVEWTARGEGFQLETARGDSR